MAGGCSVGRAHDFWLGQEVVGSTPAPSVRPLLVGPVSIQCDRLREKSRTSRSISVWQHVKFSDVSLGTRLRDSLVADEGVKKPSKQTDKHDQTEETNTYQFGQSTTKRLRPEVT